MLKGRSENGGMENDAWELLVAVVDGQGGGMGRGLVEAVKKKWPSLHVRALGTNFWPPPLCCGRGRTTALPARTPWRSTPGGRISRWGPSVCWTPNGLLGRSLPGMAEAIGGSEAVKICRPLSDAASGWPGNPSRSNSIWTRQCACWVRSAKAGRRLRRGGPPQF